MKWWAVPRLNNDNTEGEVNDLIIIRKTFELNQGTGVGEAHEIFTHPTVYMANQKTAAFDGTIMKT